MDNKYIVIFKDSVTKKEKYEYEQDVIRNGGQITNRFDSLLNGFAAVIPDHILSSFQQSNLIDYIEPDGEVTIQ